MSTLPKYPSIAQIVEAYLREHGFDGLAKTGDDCGCVLGDLYPCGDPHEELCRAAYKHPCPKDCESVEYPHEHMRSVKRTKIGAPTESAPRSTTAPARPAGGTRESRD